MSAKAFGDENDIIRKGLRKINVRVILRRTKKRLEAIINSTADLVPEIVKGIENEMLPAECPLGSVPTVATYTLINWILDANAESNGFGFPFDQPYLVLYQRLQEASHRLHQLYEIQLQGNLRENKVYSKISHDLHSVLNDLDLK